MATPRKTTRTVRKDRRGFTRTTTRTPHDLIAGARFDSVRIDYRPHGYWNDMITVTAEGPREGWSEKPIVDVRWSTGGRDMEQEPDDFIAARAFHRALRDAMTEAERLRRHLGMD